MATKTKRGGARPGAGRKPNQKSLRERADEAYVKAMTHQMRESREMFRANKAEARARVERVLGVPNTEWGPSEADVPRACETTIEGIRIQFYVDASEGEGWLFAWGYDDSGNLDWQPFDDLEDLGAILNRQPPQLDTTDDEARTAVMRLTLPDVERD